MSSRSGSRTAGARPTGTAAGTVAPGDDTRITGAVQKSTVTTKGDLLVATGSGVVARLASGTDGYVLTAASGQASGLQWVAPGSPVAATLLDAKGDLIAASGNDTAARLAVGTDGQFLRADSSQASGLRWESPGVLRNDLEVVNTYYGLPPTGASASNTMSTLNRAYAVPITVARTCTLASVGMETVASANSATWHSALYGSASGLPGNVVTDYSTVVMTTNAIYSWTSLTDVLTAGVRYWIVVWLTALTGTPTYRQRNSSDAQVSLGTSAPSTLSGSLSSHYTDTGFTGNAASSFGAPAGQIQGPALVVKLN